jgi:ryanodine receptor 2
LFGKALPCLTAIGCALPPDYALTASLEEEWFGKTVMLETTGPYDPQPINTSMYAIIF